MNDMDDSTDAINEPSPAPQREDIQVSVIKFKIVWNIKCFANFNYVGICFCFSYKDEDAPDSVKTSETYMELMWLKLIKRVKLKTSHSAMIHYGYRCDHCGMDPISGSRWHCFQCPSNISTDLCEKCAVQLSSKGGYHQPNHKMTPIIKADPLPRQGPNYLQPNFMTEN